MIYFKKLYRLINTLYTLLTSSTNKNKLPLILCQPYLSHILPTPPDSSPLVFIPFPSLPLLSNNNKLSTPLRFYPPPFFPLFETKRKHPRPKKRTKRKKGKKKMPSLTPSSMTTSPSKRDLPSLLAAALPFLRGDLSSVDPRLPSLLSTLSSAGAGECWHKHGTFLHHLAGVHRILHLWRSPSPVSLCGLFHSAYSNSYVNLAIFDPRTSRDHVRDLLGPSAERLVNLFCIVNRQTLIHDDLLFHYSDGELTDHLDASRNSLVNSLSDHHGSETWRQKINSLLPPEGVTVKHIKTGEDVHVSRRIAAIFLMMTMADFSDQLFGFQDQLFENDNGRLEFTGNDPLSTIWPGDGKPGLWLNSISRMGALYTIILREEEMYVRSRGGDVTHGSDRDEDIEMAIPPVFDNCTKVLDAEDQKTARDLYWEAVCHRGGGGGEGLERAEELLKGCIEKNPYVGEPHLVLAQVCLGMGRLEEGEAEAEEGLRLMLEWGCVWDKRVDWEGWVAWGRVVWMKAKERDWPKTAWGILNLGLVK